jgi:geranylgeranyl pyrophosphate synthase
MKNYYRKALNILDIYPDSPAKNSLFELAEYVIERSK